MIDEGWMTHQQVVYDHTNSPQVYCLGIFNPLSCFRGTPLIKPGHCPHLAHLFSITEAFRNVEISQLDRFCFGVYKEIVWLEITMAYAVAMQVFDDLEQLFENAQYLVFRKSLLILHGFQHEVFESVSLDEFHNHVQRGL